MNEAPTALAGYLLAFAGLTAGIAALALPPLAIPAGLAAWAAAALTWKGASRRSLIQAGVLFLAGVTGLLWGVSQGVTPDLVRAITANMTLIGMLIGVSFLQLVALPAGDSPGEQPRGPRAFRSTGIGVHLFGSVINISTIFMVADRLSKHGPLGREQAVLLTRYFSTAGFWSPFFAAMAAALSFAPDARIVHLIAAGLPLAVIAMLISWFGTGRHVGQDFVGYPPRYRHLRVPAILALAVLIIHTWNSDLPVIAVITLLAPLITSLALLRQRQMGLPVINHHVRRNLPRMNNELMLFLAAGVLAAGLGSVLTTLGGWSLFSTFGPLQAWLTTLLITGFAIAGVHPVIGIATFGTMLLPLEPNHSLLAMTFLASWTLGISASPLSGMNLALQGRFGLDGMDIMRWNAGYTVIMLMVTAPLFWVAGGLLGV